MTPNRQTFTAAQAAQKYLQERGLITQTFTAAQAAQKSHRPVWHLAIGNSATAGNSPSRGSFLSRVGGRRRPAWLQHMARCWNQAADAVLLGGAPLYALSVGGENGVARVFSDLQQDDVRTTSLLGACSVAMKSKRVDPGDTSSRLTSTSTSTNAFPFLPGDSHEKH